ncbi:MAG TPA: response regulator transcription factor [Sulfuricella sp.]|nr:response regulator transcription factor [Sulfuricella sp.]
MSISVILIDDHPLFRKGLSYLLETSEEGIAVVGQFATIGNVLDWLKEGGRAEAALLDRNLRDEDGLALIPELRRYGIKVIMLTSAEEAHEIREAIRQGVDGYVLKTSEPAQIFQAISAVTQGGGSLHTPVLDESMREMALPDACSKLSSRETEIVGLVALGLSNKAMGEQLGLSDNTVRNHLRSILEKLELDNRVQVATFALKHGLARKSGTA